jgi:hypothetical protein
MQQRVAVVLSLQPVTGRLLAVTGRLLAIRRCPGSTLSRECALSSCTPTVFCTHHDLHALTHRIIAGPQLAITQLGGLITRQCCQITSARNLITRIGRLDAPVSAVLALLGAAIANLARRVMHIRVAAMHKVAITGRLIAVSGCLLSTGRGLVALRSLPVSIREDLIAISELLITLKRLRSRHDDLPLSLDRPVRGIRGTIA